MISEPDRIRVILVDDHSIVRNGLKVSLEDFQDIEVVGETGDARNIVALCTSLQPHVILMDMVMPLLDGVSATRLIRESCPDTQVIALTSFSDDDNVQSALKAGAISYLLKNVSSEELATAIRRAANGVRTLAPEAAAVLISVVNRPPQVGHDLTSREREVLALMINGLNNREIAEQLVISSSTVKNHVSNILDKLGTSSRTQAVAMAVEHHIV